jgi:hypothetical protein
MNKLFTTITVALFAFVCPPSSLARDVKAIPAPLAAVSELTRDTRVDLELCVQQGRERSMQIFTIFRDMGQTIDGQLMGYVDEAMIANAQKAEDECKASVLPSFDKRVQNLRRFSSRCKAFAEAVADLRKGITLAHDENRVPSVGEPREAYISRTNGFLERFLVYSRGPQEHVYKHCRPPTSKRTLPPRSGSPTLTRPAGCREHCSVLLLPASGPV